MLKKIITLMGLLAAMTCTGEVFAQYFPPHPCPGSGLYISQNFTYKGRTIVQLSDGSYWRVPSDKHYNPVSYWYNGQRVYVTPRLHHRYNGLLSNIDNGCSAKAMQIEIYSWMNHCDWKEGTPRYHHPAVYGNPHQHFYSPPRPRSKREVTISLPRIHVRADEPNW